MDVHHVVKPPADLRLRNLDAPLRVDEKDGVRRHRHVRAFVGTHIVADDPDVLAHLGHDPHAHAAQARHVGDLNVAAVRKRRQRTVAVAGKQKAQRLVQRERTLSGVLRMRTVHIAEKHLAVALVLRSHRIVCGGERVPIALAARRNDVLYLAVAECVNRKLALPRIKAAFVQVEEDCAVLDLVWNASFGELTQEARTVLLRDGELDERQTKHARGEVAYLHAVAPLDDERKGLAMEDKAGTSAVHRHVLQAFKMDDRLFHARRAADRSEEAVLRPFLEEVVLALYEPERVAVPQTCHRRANRRRGVPLNWSHLNDRASRFRDNRSSLDASGNKSYCNKQILFHDNMKPIL